MLLISSCYIRKSEWFLLQFSQIVKNWRKAQRKSSTNATEWREYVQQQQKKKQHWTNRSKTKCDGVNVKENEVKCVFLKL